MACGARFVTANKMDGTVLIKSALMWVLGSVVGWAVQAQAAPVRDCTAVVSALQRLACFDQAAGTPARVPPATTRTASKQPSEVANWVQMNEAQRPPEDSRFLLSLWPVAGHSLQPQLLISAPALGAVGLRPYMVISCQSGISTLQLLMAEPVAPNRIRLRLFKDDRPLGAVREWRVLDTGKVIDAGRGLPAIDLLRGMGGGQRLRLESDYPALDGLMFDADGLGALIEQERQLCRW